MEVKLIVKITCKCEHKFKIKEDEIIVYLQEDNINLQISCPKCEKTYSQKLN
jgi:hypothetical protein